ncbi:YfhO family protein [Flavobacterium sp. DG1-102-2]|uniref:YfhO family protein n=1 Tax=Flavobacterium sp. DG1-102-2 TaxID=3081663 RepID=UPI002949B11E|nr:YfhO family protein [Flavobacterium sp. DG1-102-2]MDV6168598.1 YfhO family protein [Flavobacterium sp. DG1-102-2]
MKNINRLYPHFLAILGFVIVSLIYFYPVMQGKKIFQSDIAQYTGMAKEQNDFRKETGDEPYWTNSAFGGMPTYQLGAKYPHNYVKQIDEAIRFLPRPADYLFIYFLGFYILLCTFKIDPLKAFFGALAFGFSTYLIIILGVGHNAKAHAIAYMPLVIAGFVMVFQKRYIAGGLLTMVAAALEINANHIQMTYYLFLLLLVIGVWFLVGIVKNKEYRHLGISLALLAVAGILAVGTNATNLMATAEYAKYSTRHDSELTFEPDGKPKESTNAMTYEYITDYSYGIAESFDLIAPRLFGGASSEKLPADSHIVEYLQSQQVAEGEYMSEQQAVMYAEQGMPTYWGDQYSTAGPAYIGAVVFFLFVLAMFAEERKIKYAFLAGAIFSLLLSWGKFFPLLTNFFIDYFPMYNKFRAVASIQVLLEVCIPVLAVLGLNAFFTLDKDKQFKALWQSSAVALGVIVLLFLCKGMFSFAGLSDEQIAQSYPPGFLEALKEDRKVMFSADLLRSGFLILISGLVLWLNNKQRISQFMAIILVGLFMVADLFFVDKRYVDATAFQSASKIDMPFQPTVADQQIMQDTTNYRVFDIEGNLNSARASYFHKSLGGYHAAKPRKLQQLFEYQLSKNNMDVLNMLNVKYVIQKGEDGQEVPTLNGQANGNAWFVNKLKIVSTPDEEMRGLNKMNTKESAIVNKTKFPDAVTKTTFVKDSTATIKLTSYEPNYLVYKSNNPNEGVAVFSEMYYVPGWNAYIDGKEVPHFEADYALRALKIPAGKHTIEFKFEPRVVKTGSTIALISFILMVALVCFGIYTEKKNKEKALKEA